MRAAYSPMAIRSFSAPSTKALASAGEAAEATAWAGVWFWASFWAWADRAAAHRAAAAQAASRRDFIEPPQSSAILEGSGRRMGGGAGAGVKVRGRDAPSFWKK